MRTWVVWASLTQGKSPVQSIVTYLDAEPRTGVQVPPRTLVLPNISWVGLTSASTELVDGS